MKKKILKAFGLALVMLAFFLTGCAGNNSNEGLGRLSTEEQALSDSGVLTLKINPEISIRYNEDGMVTEIKGENDDGVQIIEDYNDYIGKESGVVLEELIALINEAGYFVEEIEGQAKRIVLELEAGSVMPDEKFLEKMTSNVQTAVENLDVKTKVVNDSEVITLDEAKKIALDHAGVKAGDVHFDDQEFDKDDGIKLYELEFYANGFEYEYDVDAVTGEILKHERDKKQNKKSANTSKQKTKQTDYISMDYAKEIALDHAGISGEDVYFDDQEFDIDDGVPLYEFEFYLNGNEYEYDIHAISGEILSFEHDIKKSKAASKETSQSERTQISKDEAIEIALNHAGLTRSQVSFDDIELDEDDGRLIWEIEFDSEDWEFEYEIDAYSKNILDFKKEYDD